MDRADVDWMREIAAEKKAPRPVISGRNEAFDSGATRQKPIEMPAVKPKSTLPATTVVPAQSRRKFGFL
jgi:hypothetical protein